MKKRIGLGDFLLRLNPAGYLRFMQADHFEINYTGAAELRKFRVGTRHIV